MKILRKSEWVAEAAQCLGIDFRVPSAQEAAVIREGVVTKFTRGMEGATRTWERLLAHASVNNPDGWKLMDDYLSGRPFIVFFNEHEDKIMLEFPPGSMLVPIIEECPGFEFYVTDHEASYMLCFNHEDFLIGAGAAAEWDVLTQQTNGEAKRCE